MEYIVLLDYANGEVIKIRLSEEDTILANEAENYEDFLRTWKISTISDLRIVIG